MNRERAAVLIHGCHLDANLGGRKWTEIVWGSNAIEKPSRAGRVVEGIRLARLKKAEAVIFGTGASERAGIPEAQYTYAFLLDCLKPLSGLLKVSQGGLRKWIEERAVVDTESKNTVEEIEKGIHLAVKHKVDSLYLVTSDWHAPRVRAVASQVSDQIQRQGVNVPNLFVSASLGDARDVRIVERAHRPDRDNLQNRLFEIIGIFFENTKEEKMKILERIEKPLHETDFQKLR